MTDCQNIAGKLGFDTRVESLDVTLFDAIDSQTVEGDRRSLLALQRAVARKFGTYHYLEIGSHLGGSILPHLLDARCKLIYSIDPRPPVVPDDRRPGYSWRYDGNSTQRMLDLLTAAGGKVDKMMCFESTACEVDQDKIAIAPELIFIDGEHTNQAVMQDYLFCRAVAAGGWTIVFHDVKIVHKALRKIVKDLGREVLAAKLEGSVFAIFSDPSLANTDPYLRKLCRENRHFLRDYSRLIWRVRLMDRINAKIPRWVFVVTGWFRATFGVKDEKSV